MDDGSPDLGELSHKKIYEPQKLPANIKLIKKHSKILDIGQIFS
jgi:hypothetical protein